MGHQESIDFAQKYLEDIISFFGENVAVEASAEDEVINLEVESSELNSILIGRNAENLRAMQMIVSTALRNQDAELSRVNIDVADYKKQRAEKVMEKARGWMEQVLETGESKRVHLNAADRRVVHHLASSEFDEIETHSEGEGRDRTLVISKAE